MAAGLKLDGDSGEVVALLHQTSPKIFKGIKQSLVARWPQILRCRTLSSQCQTLTARPNKHDTQQTLIRTITEACFLTGWCTGITE